MKNQDFALIAIAAVGLFILAKFAKATPATAQATLSQTTSKVYGASGNEVPAKGTPGYGTDGQYYDMSGTRIDTNGMGF